MTEPPHFNLPDFKPVIKMYNASYCGENKAYEGFRAKVLCRDDRPEVCRAKFEDERLGRLFGWQDFLRSDFDIDYFDLEAQSASAKRK